MYVRVVFPELVNKNIPKQINTIVNRDSNPEEPRVLALEDLVFVATSSQIQSIDKPNCACGISVIYFKIASNIVSAEIQKAVGSDLAIIFTVKLPFTISLFG